MKNILACIIICYSAISQANAADTEQLTQESRAAVMALGSELKTTLQASIKANGIIESISVCNIKAPQISQKISDEHGMAVGRRSLKYRNPKNKPDDWEKSVLEQFEQRKANGEAVSTLEFSELTELNGKKLFRYMKAIPTDDVCLNCHGDNVAHPFVSKINSLYTDDKAIGFKKGDIRGAFSVIRPVN
ncbi:MAG: DUF3365 domain-containing protein [Gammaproteobacteria bacterium]|jgi:DNA topoisomerase VI subunit B|nr:DUF3365 domain-containing protein [Gammaproteobacteria bacterium]